MIKIFFVLTFVSSSAIHAQEIPRANAYLAMPRCGRALISDEQFLASSVSDSRVEVMDLRNSSANFVIETSKKVVDLKLRDKTLYVLTEETLDAWNLENQKNIFSYKSHPDVSTANDTKATGFILVQNTAVIAHGSLGFSQINLADGSIAKLLKMQTPSRAEDIDLVDAHSAAAAIDSDDGRNFRGLYILDLVHFSVAKQIAVDNALLSAVRVLDSNRLMLVYFNSIWKFDLSKTLSSRSASPQLRQPSFPGVEETDIYGKVFFDEKNLYACFKTVDRKLKPMVFDVAALHLN